MLVPGAALAELFAIVVVEAGAGVEAVGDGVPAFCGAIGTVDPALLMPPRGSSGLMGDLFAVAGVAGVFAIGVAGLAAEVAAAVDAAVPGAAEVAVVAPG